LIGLDLIERGIDVNHKDDKGQTSLHYCGVYRNLELAESILLNGGDPNIRDVYRNNAMWTSVFNARGNYELVKLLVVNGGGIASKNTSNRSTLDFARQINEQKLLDILGDNIDMDMQ
jgi:ankyrin repeat protein